MFSDTGGNRLPTSPARETVARIFLPCYIVAEPAKECVFTPHLNPSPKKKKRKSHSTIVVPSSHHCPLFGASPTKIVSELTKY